MSLDTLELEAKTHAAPKHVQWVIDAQNGDKEAFGRIYEHFFPTVYGVCMKRLKNVHDAEDLVQQIFAHALVKLPTLREPSALAGWLCTMAVRMCINSRTRKHAVHEVQGGQDFMQDTIVSEDYSSVEAESEEIKNLLFFALHELKPVDRETLYDFYIRDLSLKEMHEESKEIDALFGVPDSPGTAIGTIKRRLHVARKRLCEIMENMGISEKLLFAA